MRVYVLEAFFIVSYGLGIFLLNLLIGFLTPLDVDDLDGDSPLLPSGDDASEFKPFVRRLPEYKFWYSCCKAIVIGNYSSISHVARPNMKTKTWFEKAHERRRV